MADDRTYIKLHDGMPGHPKVRGLSDKAFRAFVSALCYCSEYRTDGEVVAAVARDLGTAKVWRELVAAGLAEPSERGYAMHDYLEHQRSAQQIDELREKRRQSGRLGGRPRKPEETKPKAKANQEPKQEPKQNESKKNPETEEVPNGTSQAEPSGSSLRSDPRTDGKDLDQPNAGKIVKAWIDSQRQRPPNRLIGQVGQAVKGLLGEGFGADPIGQALAEMTRKGLNPATLPSLVNAVVNGGNVRPIRPDGHLSREDIDGILGPDYASPPPPPPELEDDHAGYVRWLEEQNAGRLLVREREALERLQMAGQR